MILLGAGFPTEISRVIVEPDPLVYRPFTLEAWLDKGSSPIMRTVRKRRAVVPVFVDFSMVVTRV